MFLLVSSNGYTTATIHVRTLRAATETYVALRDLSSFKDSVWTREPSNTGCMTMRTA